MTRRDLVYTHGLGGWVVLEHLRFPGREALGTRVGGSRLSNAWSVTDLAEMVDAAASKPGKRGPYRRRVAA